MLFVRALPVHNHIKRIPILTIKSESAIIPDVFTWPEFNGNRYGIFGFRLRARRSGIPDFDSVPEC